MWRMSPSRMVCGSRSTPRSKLHHHLCLYNSINIWIAVFIARHAISRLLIRISTGKCRKEARAPSII